MNLYPVSSSYEYVYLHKTGTSPHIPATVSGIGIPRFGGVEEVMFRHRHNLGKFEAKGHPVV
jgi:hypothetical protein